MASIALLLLLLLWSPLLVFYHAVHARSDFMNIDCGKEYSYTDSRTGLQYISDSQFIDSGKTYKISRELWKSVLNQQVINLRCFPNGTRNCYTLKPVVKGEKYLIRASFLYGNYDRLNSLPQFDLYLGTDLWQTISFPNENMLLFSEIMAVAPTGSFLVCLVNTGFGVPFISALELRWLGNSIYNEVTLSQSLVCHNRINFGGDRDIIIRHPEDSYDRIWLPFSLPNWRLIFEASGIIIDNNYKPPLEVMQMAVIPKNDYRLNWTMNVARTFSKYLLFMHFAELQNFDGNKSRILNVLVNNDVYCANLNPKFLAITTPKPHIVQGYEKLNFSVYTAGNSTLPPIINAIEIYAVRQMTNKATSSGDVDAIMSVKSSYNLRRNWMGDPCLPKDLAWNGLKCSYNSFKTTRIISLNLSSSGLTGEISPSIAKLSELQYLDLSVNNLTGSIPDFLTKLSQLKYLNLTDSGLSGQVPEGLRHRSAIGSLILSYDGNEKSVQDMEYKNRKKNVITVAASVCSVLCLLLIVSIVFCIHKRNSEDLERRNFSRNRNEDETRVFNFDELVNMTANFSAEIGKGEFSRVFFGILENDLQVAVEMLSQSLPWDWKKFQEEALLLAGIHHTNLVSLIGYCKDKHHLALVYEYMEKGSLAYHLAGNVGENTLCWAERIRIANEVAQGLVHLHEGCVPAIIHRDVETSSILLSKNMEAKITNFQLSRFLSIDGHSQISNESIRFPGCFHPDYINTRMFTEKSDVYSFGIVLMELVMGQSPIITRGDVTNVVQQLMEALATRDISSIVDQRLHGVYNYSSICKALQLVIECVAHDSSCRPDMSEVLVKLHDCLGHETGSADDVAFDRNNSSSIRPAFPMIAAAINPQAR